MSDPVNLEALREAVDWFGDDVRNLAPSEMLVGGLARKRIHDAARSLLDGRRNWYCSSDVDDLGHPPHSEGCGPVIIVRVTE